MMCGIEPIQSIIDMERILECCLLHRAHTTYSLDWLKHRMLFSSQLTTRLTAYMFI